MANKLDKYLTIFSLFYKSILYLPIEILEILFLDIVDYYNEILVCITQIFIQTNINLLNFK